jgi:hypothetical protein
VHRYGLPVYPSAGVSTTTCCEWALLKLLICGGVVGSSGRTISSAAHSAGGTSVAPLPIRVALGDRLARAAYIYKEWTA